MTSLERGSFFCRTALRVSPPLTAASAAALSGSLISGQVRVDNWVGVGATADSGSIYSFGGSVSGLSVTAVLRTTAVTI